MCLIGCRKHFSGISGREDEWKITSNSDLRFYLNSHASSSVRSHVASRRQRDAATVALYSVPQRTIVDISIQEKVISFDGILNVNNTAYIDVREITNHGYVSRIRLFKLKSCVTINSLYFYKDWDWVEQKLARALLQPSTREHSTFAQRMKRSGNGRRGGEERTEMESLEDASLGSRDDSSPDSYLP